MSIVLAFSGGLDTSFCVPYLRETYGEPVYTVTVDTGGVAPGEAEALEARALALGAAAHRTIPARQDLYDDLLSYLIKGNVLRGGVYPLCVGPERVVQARHTVAVARAVGARAIAHGSTGAGNDQVRFDVALRLLAPDLDLLTPIRERGLSRADTTAFLRDRGFDVPAKTTAYSINRGLWGTTIGGRETITTTEPLPDDAYPDTTAPAEAPDAPEDLEIAFEGGLPVALAALILITAHRELEKITLTKWQRYQKDQLGEFYGMLLHEAQYFDPVMRDVEALLDSSQRTVDGTVRVRLYKGALQVLGCDSPYSLFDPAVASYGEENALWDGRDARGFSRLAGVQALLAAQARRRAEQAEAEK